MNYSIVMPVYNGKKYFETALVSAIKVLEDGDEIIVVEDGSTDGGVEEILKRNSSGVPIRYYYKDNGGVASALNFGLANAKNRLFTWLSHDDIYLPSRLRADRMLRGFSPQAITVSNFYLFYEDGKHLTYIDSVKSLSRNQRFRLLSRRFLNGNCLTAPVDTLLSLGGFDLNRKHTQDYALWLRMMRTSDFVAIPEPTVLSRQHPNQDSKTQPVAARNEYISLLRENIYYKDLLDPRNAFDILRIFNSVFLK